jgi:hypothetical protein
LYGYTSNSATVQQLDNTPDVTTNLTYLAFVGANSVNCFAVVVSNVPVVIASKFVPSVETSIV